MDYVPKSKHIKLTQIKRFGLPLFNIYQEFVKEAEIGTNTETKY